MTHPTPQPTVPDEFWKPVSGWSDLYEVSNLGRVRQVSGRLLNPWEVKGTHLSVTLCRNGNKHKTLVHRMVAEAFIGPIPAGNFVNHIDGNGKNNCLDNLECVTPAENTRHAVRTGLINQKGEKNNHAKLTWRDVRLIRNARFYPNFTHRRLAGIFGVNKATISKIQRHERWPDGGRQALAANGGGK